MRSSSAWVLARSAAARSTGRAFSRIGSSSSACLRARSLSVFSTSVSWIALSILSRSNSTRMSPFLTGVPSSMARSTTRGSAQALGLIETSVIRSASKTPSRATSILNGPFSTLAVAGLLLLEGEAVAGASVLAAGLASGFSAGADLRTAQPKWVPLPATATFHEKTQSKAENQADRRVNHAPEHLH